MEIPYTAISKEALLGVVEEFVLREGTDYGAQEYSLEQKIEQVLAQLKAGKIRLTYDEETETCNLERTDP
ncbi:MAG: YheU family protein [Gammaproteobacteria bacterium]